MWRGHFFLLFVFPPSVMKWLLPHLCKHYETLFFKTWPMERFVILFWFGGQNDYRYKWIPKWMDMNGNRKTQEQSNENREKRSVKAKRKVKAAMFIYGTLSQEGPGVWRRILLDSTHIVAFSVRELRFECLVSVHISCANLLALFELDKCKEIWLLRGDNERRKITLNPVL